MCNNNGIDEAIIEYIRLGQPEINKRLAWLKDQENATSTDILKANFRSAESIQAFLNIERENIHDINSCTSIEQLNDLVYELFNDIPGISEHTLNDYIYSRAFILDINPEANCSIYLSRTFEKKLHLHITVEQLRDKIRKRTNIINELSDIHIVHFANKNIDTIIDLYK